MIKNKPHPNPPLSKGREGEGLVSIIILAYNGEGVIKDCLDSVLRQSYENREIIVVDNASADGTLEILDGFKNSDLRFRIIANEKNIGFAGHNIGIDESQGEFVLCMNQDAVLNENFISRAVELMETDEKIGAMQGKILRKELGIKNNESRIIDTTGHVIYKSRRVADRGQGEEDKGQYDKIEGVFGVNGAVAFFRKACLEAVKIEIPSSQFPVPSPQYYDPDFFMYKEDIDLSWRIRLYGWKIVFCPKAIAYVERTSKPIDEKGGTAETIKTRRKQAQFVKNLSFKNHRLALVKNDLPRLFIKHLPWILSREIGVWLYVLFFEPKTWPAIGELFRQMPRAWRKRKIIMKNKKVGAEEMGKWFR